MLTIGIGQERMTPQWDLFDVPIFYGIFIYLLYQFFHNVSSASKWISINEL